MQENQEVMFKVILNYSWNLGFSFQTKRKSAERNEILHIAPWLFSGSQVVLLFVLRLAQCKIV